MSLDHEPRRHGASHEQHEASRPNAKTTAERVLRTRTQWLAAQAPQPASLTQLQALLTPTPPTATHQRPKPSRRRC
jgi:hypothetical protein